MENKRIIISCKQATHLSELKNEGKLNFWQKISLRMHLFTCNSCRKFIKQSQLLAQQLKSLGKKMHQHPKFELSPDSKERLQQQIDKEFNS